METKEFLAGIEQSLALASRESTAVMRRVVPGGKLTKSQIKALVEALRDIVSVLAECDDEDRAELYQQLGVELTYPDGRIAVHALPRGVKVRVGGGT